MSLDQPASATTTLPTNQQYATFANPPTTYRSFHTMASPDIQQSALTSKLQIYALSIPKAWESPLCGAGAGLASGIVSCPLDVIKTKLQAQGGFKARRGGTGVQANQLYHGMIGSARTIFNQEGIRGLYRGLGPMLLGYLPTWAVYLTVYEKARKPYEDMCSSWWLARMYASVTAGACSTILTNPIWVIKTRLMSQSNRSSSEGKRVGFHYKNTWDAAKQMYRGEGIRSFYSGLTPAILGLTHVAVQFPLYEFFKMHFTGYGIGEHPPEDHGSHWLAISAATFLSKTCASTATYPHEVLRTRLQTQQRRYGVTSSDGMQLAPERYNGLMRTCKIIIREEGWRGFYAGLGTNLIRAIPSAMTTMLTYEYLQRMIHDLKDGGEKLVKEKEAW